MPVMYKRLPAQTKKELIHRVAKGESVSKICREQGISRTVLYKWIASYKKAARRTKPLTLRTHNPIGKKHYRYITYNKEKEILKVALKKPSLTPIQIANAVKMSVHGAWNVLKRHNLNTRQLREAYVERNGSSLVHEYGVEEKWALIRRIEQGESVSMLCREFGVSRTVLYRWLKRYQADQDKASLSSMRPKEEKHWRYVEEAPDVILEIVTTDPQLSPVQIAQKIKEKIGKKILGVHGVYNFLKKHRLNRVELRIQYAKSQEKAIEKQAVQTEISLPTFSFDTFISFVPPPLRSKTGVLRNFIPLSLFGIGTVSLIAFWIRLIADADGLGSKIGIFFSFTALIFGMFFFLYSLKSYFMISIVLSFSRHEDDESREPKPFFDSVLSMFGIKLIRERPTQKKPDYGAGLMPDLSSIHLKRHPFVSIHLAMYNEKRVIDRLLTAATSMRYDNYEVIVADDSTDPEALTLLAKWKHHPNVKILHRESRDGYKGQALQNALKHTDKRAEFIMIFDADFIPYPDSATSFLKYFQSVIGSLDPQAIKKSPIAAVQGYQWHVLNKSENWVTRGVRSEYAGSYVVERSATELYQGLKQISGSVYMIRRDVVEQIGWGRSITEDFEFTLKLYNQGFKVVYTPYIQAPSEAVSTVKRIIRQRMRWAEGHSFNVKKMFWSLLQNPKLTFPEKFELVYLTPYYLQSAFFIAGTLAWFTAELVFKTRLPFWTEVWGWSLIFTNMFALPLMNMVGLFLEESDEKDYVGLLSFVGLSYLVAPFQGYAAIKGFLEKEEGPWFRTPKTGRITDSFTPGHFYRYVKGFFGIKQALSNPVQSISSSFGVHPYLALATANNSFHHFAVKPAKRMRWMGKSVLAIMLICAIMLNYLSFFTPKTYAAAPDPTIEQQINIIDTTDSVNRASYADDSLGLITWDSSEYPGATVYFEADIRFFTAGSPTSALAALFDSSGTQVTGSEVSFGTDDGSYHSVISGALTLGTLPNLETNKKYTAEIKCNVAGTGTCASIKAARLIIVQTSPNRIERTDTQVELGANASTITSSYASSLSAPKFYTYTQSLFNPTPVASFEATIRYVPGTSATSAGPTGAAASTNCTNDASIGTSTPWTSPGNAFSADGTFATVSVDGSFSNYVKCDHFGFSIPTNATITGITVTNNRKASGTGNGGVTDKAVRVIKGGSIGTTDASTATVWPLTQGSETHQPADPLWGQTWTPADINATTFGVAVSAQKASAAGAAITASVDAITITIDYTTPVPGAAFAVLWDRTLGAAVAGAEVVTQSTTSVATRAASITLVDSHQYEVRLKSESLLVTAVIANARLLLHQGTAGGISQLETLQQYNNAAVSGTSLTSGGYPNRFDKSHFYANGTNPVVLFETDAYTSVATTTTWTAQLNYNGGTGAVSGTNGTPAVAQTSVDIWASLPATATDIDMQVSDTGTGNATSTNSWLKIRISGLSVPENILLLLPLIFFLPKIIQIIQEAWRRKKKGETWTAVWQYIRTELELEKNKLLQKLYTTLGPPLARVRSGG